MRPSVVLVVDDEPKALALVTAILTAEGYQVRPADSGELALASAAAKCPDLILLDIRMPAMDGFEVCRRLKASAETRNVPVVFLSAAHEVEERLQGLRLGAVDFILKPFRRNELLARVQMHVEAARQKLDLERQVAERTAELRRVNEQLVADLGERQRIERAFVESEQRFRDLADRAPVGIWVIDSNQKPTFYNRRALLFAGRKLEELSAEGWSSLVHPDDLQSVYSKYLPAVAACRRFRIECRVRRTNGRYRWVLNTGIPRFINGVFAGHIGTSIDITDLKRGQERLLVAQKLECLTALTAGIAHDFNNLAGAILAEADIALAEVPPNSPVRENLGHISSMASRAAEIVALLVTYAGRGEVMFQSVDLTELVKDALRSLNGTFAPKTSVNVALAKDLPPIRANAPQIRQVVMNLVTNAAEATLEAGGGPVTVTTSLVHIGRTCPADWPEDLPQGDYCHLAVSDSACGMPEDVRQRAFDPYYSTKFVGRGLGLAVVQGILRAHGGAIHVKSGGNGSTFEVLLRCACDCKSESSRKQCNEASYDRLRP